MLAGSVTERVRRNVNALIGRVLIAAALIGAGLIGITAPVRADESQASVAAAARRTIPFQIIAFGSSSTQGIGASTPASAYPARLEALLNEQLHSRPAVTVVNRGIGGEDIVAMMKRLERDVLARKPDLVIWQVGSNDSLRGISVERFTTELRTGIVAMRAAGIEVILMEPQWSPMTRKADARNLFVGAVRDVGAEERVDVVRRYEMMSRWIAVGLVSEHDLIGPDNLHMTDRGYDMLAKAVFVEVETRSKTLRDRTALASRH